MEERHLKNIKRYLQNEEVQERIQQYMQRGRSEATVSIGRVAQLFQLKESKLRDWEARGLLKPVRSKDLTGQRQYSPVELDKLAIIKELVDEGGYAPSEIPPDIDSIWHFIAYPDGQPDATLQFNEAHVEHTREVDHMPIDKHIELADEEVFWRYFVSQALRLSIMLICEDIPDTLAGLVLPLQKKNVSDIVDNPGDLPRLGYSLIGWLGRNRSFYTFLDIAPSFEFPSDFRVQPLAATGENKSQDETLIVVQRKARSLNLGAHLVEAIRRLLEPIYDNVEKWRPCFDLGMRDWLYQVAIFTGSSNTSDEVLNGLADIIVRLGGKTTDGLNRWRFSCILSPKDLTLPLQQRSLVVRAKTKLAPAAYKVGATLVSPDEPIISLNLRAFQSGRVIYRHRVTSNDASVAYRELEEPIGSAIAVPVGGENEAPLAVIYVVSAQPDAFNDEDQRLLRMMGRMIEELFKTYQARLQVTEKFSNLVANPGVIDLAFADFASESDFITDVEDLLSTINKLAEGKERVNKEDLDDPEVLKNVEQSPDAVSFIAIDIDNQTSFTNKYGYQMTKNLSRAVGLKIQWQINVLFTNPSDCKLYHVYADRFFLLLKGVSLEKARETAELLKQALSSTTYQIDVLHPSSGLPRLSDSVLVPAEITVRLGVASYQYTKLKEILQRYPVEETLASATSLITNFLDKMLKAGQDEGGNKIFSWDYNLWGYSK